MAEPTQSATSVKVTAATKRKRALELRLGGLNYRQIAEAVGYTNPGTAHKAVMQELAKIPKEAADELRTTELERYDEMQARMTEALRRGDLSVIPNLIRLSDQRAKLTGLYSADTTAEHVEVTIALQGFLQNAEDLVAAMDADPSPQVATAVENAG